MSYLLNWKGPSIAINSACSSSLVAVHLACESLRSGTSELALAGGAQIMATGQFHMLADSIGMLSAGGRCRTFDQRADGFVPGEAVAVVVLKPLSRALRDRDLRGMHHPSPGGFFLSGRDRTQLHMAGPGLV